MQNSSIEFEGKNVEDALAKASSTLKVKKDQLRYDIISSGSTGIFGLVGVKKAKIRITSHSGNGSLGGASEALSKAGISSLVDEAFKTPSTSSTQANRSSKENGSSRRKPSRFKAKPKPDTDSKQSPVSDNSSSFETAPADIPLPPIEKKEVTPQVQPERPLPRQPLIPAPEAPIKAGEEALKVILDTITDETVITVDRNVDPVLFRIEGGNSSVIIGKRGQTLEAIQYLIDKIINKQSEERIRVLVDVEGYLETRRQNLEDLALRLAEKAKRTGKPATIGQMTAHDRRIVHMTLKEDKAVRTQSMGDGYYRRLVIFPKKGRKSGQGKRRNANA